MKIFKNILAFLLFISVLNVQAQKSVEIRLKPKVGSTFVLRTTMDMDMKMNIPTGPMETKIKTIFDMSFKTLSLAKDINNMKVSIDRVVMDMQNPMMNVSYDSDKKEQETPIAEQMGQSFKNMVNNPIELKINTLAKLVKSVDKFKELEEQVTNQFIEFPEGKVKIGDSWTKTTKMAQIGEIEFTYTLVSIEKKTLNLSVTGKILEVKDTTMKIKSSKISGTASLDRKTGETLILDISMETNVEVNAQGQLMDVEMKVLKKSIGTKK